MACLPDQHHGVLANVRPSRLAREGKATVHEDVIVRAEVGHEARPVLLEDRGVDLVEAWREGHALGLEEGLENLPAVPASITKNVLGEQVGHEGRADELGDVDHFDTDS